MKWHNVASAITSMARLGADDARCRGQIPPPTRVGGRLLNREQQEDIPHSPNLAPLSVSPAVAVLT